MTKLYSYLCTILFHLSIFEASPQLIGDEVSPVENREYPFVVSLAVAKCLGAHFCTGTLISKKHVLTAAHCFAITVDTLPFMVPSKIAVIVGSDDVTRGTKYEVNEWRTFDRWAAENDIIINCEANLSHDIAVVTLMSNITEDIEPAKISNLDMKSIYGKTVVAAGWGLTKQGRPRLLRKTNLRVLNRKTCLRNLRALNMAPWTVLNHLCTADGSPITTLGCGDSGGPILINGDEVVGVNLAFCTEDKDHPNQQNLHAAVKFYMKFIMSAMDFNE